ncbi:MAG: hypothetical protein ABDH49_08925 [Candidatus Hydrothermales bacterium]
MDVKIKPLNGFEHVVHPQEPAERHEKLKKFLEEIKSLLEKNGIKTGEIEAFSDNWTYPWYLIYAKSDVGAILISIKIRKSYAEELSHEKIKNVEIDMPFVSISYEDIKWKSSYSFETPQIK